MLAFQHRPAIAYAIAVVVNNLKDKETFFRVWRDGQSLRYTSPPNATITFLFQPRRS